MPHVAGSSSGSGGDRGERSSSVAVAGGSGASSSSSSGRIRDDPNDCDEVKVFKCEEDEGEGSSDDVMGDDKEDLIRATECDQKGRLSPLSPLSPGGYSNSGGGHSSGSYPKNGGGGGQSSSLRPDHSALMFGGKLDGVGMPYPSPINMGLLGYPGYPNGSPLSVVEKMGFGRLLGFGCNGMEGLTQPPPAHMGYPGLSRPYPFGIQYPYAGLPEVSQSPWPQGMYPSISGAGSPGGSGGFRSYPPSLPTSLPSDFYRGFSPLLPGPGLGGHSGLGHHLVGTHKNDAHHDNHRSSNAAYDDSDEIINVPLDLSRRSSCPETFSDYAAASLLLGLRDGRKGLGMLSGCGSVLSPSRANISNNGVTTAGEIGLGSHICVCMYCGQIPPIFWRRREWESHTPPGPPPAPVPEENDNSPRPTLVKGKKGRKKAIQRPKSQVPKKRGRKPKRKFERRVKFGPAVNPAPSSPPPLITAASALTSVSDGYGSDIDVDVEMDKIMDLSLLANMSIFDDEDDIRLTPSPPLLTIMDVVGEYSSGSGSSGEKNGIGQDVDVQNHFDGIDMKIKSENPFSWSSLADQKSSDNHHSSKNASDSGQSSNSQKEKKAAHIKKPLNAFMLYMKEMRAKVVAECTLKESAAINQILGRRWHALGREEQAKYYELARRERQLHMQMYPNWSSAQNRTHHEKKRKKKQDQKFDGGNSMKKCRARYGLDQQNQWCKPCRRKKKCIRYLEEANAANGGVNSVNSNDDNLGSAGDPLSPDSIKGADSDMDTSSNMDMSSPSFSLTSPGMSLASPGMSLPSPALTSPSGVMPSPASLASPAVSLPSLQSPMTPSMMEDRHPISSVSSATSSINFNTVTSTSSNGHGGSSSTSHQHHNNNGRGSSGSSNHQNQHHSHPSNPSSYGKHNSNSPQHSFHPGTSPNFGFGLGHLFNGSQVGSPNMNGHVHGHGGMGGYPFPFPLGLNLPNFQKPARNPVGTNPHDINNPLSVNQLTGQCNSSSSSASSLSSITSNERSSSVSSQKSSHSHHYRSSNQDKGRSRDRISGSNSEGNNNKSGGESSNKSNPPVPPPVIGVS